MRRSVEPADLARSCVDSLVPLLYCLTHCSKSVQHYWLGSVGDLHRTLFDLLGPMAKEHIELREVFVFVVCFET